MVALKLAALASLLLSNAWPALAQEQELIIEETTDKIERPANTPNLNVKISVAFPQAEIFGVKLVNGQATEAIISVENHEPEQIAFALVGGSLLTPSDQPGAPDPPVVLRNLTSKGFGARIPAGESETFPYSFAVEMHPQDVTLSLVAVFQVGKGQIATHQFYNSTVSVVEAPSSFFDPQLIFLYLVLAAVFGGTCYFIYSTWVTTFFPQKRGRGKGGERAKKSSQGSKKVDPADQVSVVGADGPAVTTGAKAYDESWIPMHHLQRPEAKRVASGSKARPKSRQGPASP